MPSIAYRTIKGATYAYSSESYWDPVKKAPRTKRTYLGKVDPETGEIVRVYKKGEKTDKTVTVAEPVELSQVESLLVEVKKLSEENRKLNEENRKLNEQNAFLMDKLMTLKNVFKSLP